MVNENGLGHLVCPNCDAKVPYIYIVGKRGKAMSEALDKHLQRCC